MKAWPIDPLDLRDLKLEVSEKLPSLLAKTWLALKPSVRLRLVGSTLEILDSVVRQCARTAGKP